MKIRRFWGGDDGLCPPPWPAPMPVLHYHPHENAKSSRFKYFDLKPGGKLFRQLVEQGLGFVSLTVDIICFRNFYIVNQHIADLAQGHNLLMHSLSSRFSRFRVLILKAPHLGGVFGGNAVKQLFQGNPLAEKIFHCMALVRLCRPGRPAALINMVTLFTSRNHLVNDLLGNVARSFSNFTDLSTGSSSLRCLFSGGC